LNRKSLFNFSQIEGAMDGAGPEERLSFTAITESFPFSTAQKSSWDADEAREHLFAQIPSEIRAWGLCETYYRNGCWTGMPVTQSETVELLNLIYYPVYDGGSEDKKQPWATTQQMAVLYLIFALGSLVDLDLPPYNYDADHYFDLACAAMSIKSLFETPAVVTVQALTLLASYYAHGGQRFSMDAAYSCISLASSISQRVGGFLFQHACYH
jgi:hypothetical protein